jgi:hypothetical protein
MGEQMQPEVGVGHVHGWLVEVDDRAHHVAAHLTVRVVGRERGQVDALRCRRRVVEGRRREPHVEHLAGGMHRREAGPGAHARAIRCHAATLPDVV